VLRRLPAAAAARVHRAARVLTTLSEVTSVEGGGWPASAAAATELLAVRWTTSLSPVLTTLSEVTSVEGGGWPASAAAATELLAVRWTTSLSPVRVCGYPVV
jgi:hypothetical protein